MSTLRSRIDDLMKALAGIPEHVVRLRPRREATGVPTDAGRRDPAVAQRLENFEKRLQHLEAMVEGLQDAVHREWVRQGGEIDQLQRKAEPSEIRRALGKDAREHGI